MQVTLEKLSPVLVELNVEIDAKRVGVEVKQAYAALSRTAKVKGFRPGKAPRKLLTQLYGPRIAADVAQKLVDSTYPEVIAEQKLQPVSQPAVEPGALKETQVFSYKARVEIIPEIEKVEYEGFEVTKPKSEVEEKAVDEELENLRKANSWLEPAKEKRPVEAGDAVVVDVDVSVDGESIEGAGGEGLNFELGEGNLIPEVEEALMGTKVGDVAEALAEMPAGHPNPKLKGKKATFKLTLKEFKVRVLPKLDDEFAKDLGEHETLDEVKKSVREQLEKRATEAAENAVAEALVEALAKANPIDVPSSLVARQSQQTEQEVMGQAMRAGQSGGLPPELKGKIKEDSERKVRAGLLMAEIAKQEEIKIGEPEIEEGLKELAEQTGRNIAKLRAEYKSAQARETLVGMILENKVLDIIESKSKITEE
ncbi:MAG: trigger factor [Polyangiaceae bacterium]|nr:trigger factor [Polyangiaceae bacterium]